MNQDGTSPLHDRVADAPSDNWVYQLLPVGLWPFAQLARWDRPIGWWLLLWPCWWSVALALSQGKHGAFPLLNGSLQIAATLLFFLLGAVAMRGAGCTYNDIVDVDIDGRVARTASRPIPSGRITKLAAILFLFAQAFTGLLALLALCLLPWVSHGGFNSFAFFLALGSLGIIAAYPFAKRVTDWPQFVLGLAFSWGALLGWAVILGEVSASAVWMYGAAIFWTIGYDTIYAHQDREDDALIGVRSTARLFGRQTRGIVSLLYLLTLGCLFGSFVHADAAWPTYLGLLLGSLHMAWQMYRLDIDDPDVCLALFKSNRNFGWIIFAGLIVALAL